MTKLEIARAPVNRDAIEKLRKRKQGAEQSNRTKRAGVAYYSLVIQ